jgi:hypothetical protein
MIQTPKSLESGYSSCAELHKAMDRIVLLWDKKNFPDGYLGMEWGYAQKVLGVHFNNTEQYGEDFSCELHSSLKLMDEALEIKAKSNTRKRARMLDAQKQ